MTSHRLYVFAALGCCCPNGQLIVEKVQGGVGGHVSILMPALFEKLGDNKTVIRQVRTRGAGLVQCAWCAVYRVVVRCHANGGNDNGSIMEEDRPL